MASRRFDAKFGAPDERIDDVLLAHFAACVAVLLALHPPFVGTSLRAVPRALIVSGILTGLLAAEATGLLVAAERARDPAGASR